MYAQHACKIPIDF